MKKSFLYNKEQFLGILNKNCKVLFDIDWKGAKQLSNYKELNLLKLFILPPSKEELEKRLVARNQDDRDSIKKRLLAYSEDIKHSSEYDHVLINDNVQNTVNKIHKIIDYDNLIIQNNNFLKKKLIKIINK